MGLVTAGVAMGLAGTVAMDLWALALDRVAGLPRPNWALVGRWLTEAMRGRVFHDDIKAVPEVRAELALGWVFHYAVGIAYGVIFVLIAGPGWLAAPVFLPLWLFALATLAAGWFLLHPGLGMGWAASRTPSPWKVRGLGLVAHTVFGLGMWSAAVL